MKRHANPDQDSGLGSCGLIADTSCPPFPRSHLNVRNWLALCLSLVNKIRTRLKSVLLADQVFYKLQWKKKLSRIHLVGNCRRRNDRCGTLHESMRWLVPGRVWDGSCQGWPGDAPDTEPANARTEASTGAGRGPEQWQGGQFLNAIPRSPPMIYCL